MRILLGIPEKGSHGGPAACEPPFADELRRLGHDVVEEIYVYAGTNSTTIQRVRRVLATARRFQERMSDGRFDLVHLNTAFDAKALLRDAFIVPKLTGKGAKVFLKLHGSDSQLLDSKNPFYAALWRRVLSGADGIGVLSTDERENFLRAKVPEKKLFVVKNIVEKNSQQRGSEFLRRWDLPAGRPLLLFISRFIRTKGLFDVIDACGLLRDRGEKFYLLGLGDGPEFSEAKARADRLNLQADVRFFGYIPEDETDRFYANSDILLFPTYHTEGFPMVIFNAAAVGLPIITTNIRAAADYLTEPENCLWTTQRDPETLAGKITELLQNPDLRSDMKRNNTALAAKFTREIVTEEYLDAFRKIANST